MESSSENLTSQQNTVELDHAEKRFMNFFNAMNSGIALYHSVDGEHFIFSGLNSTGVALSKIRQEDVIGLEVRDVFPGVVQMGLYDVFRRVWASGESEMLPTTIYKDERIVQWVENRVFKISEHEIVAVYEDISPQKKNEESLWKSESRFRYLFERMNEGFALHEVICNDAGEVTDYRYLDINPAYERMTGLEREKTVGRTVREVNPGIEEHCIAVFGRVALTGEPAEVESYSQDLDRYYRAKAYSPERGKFAVLFEEVTEIRKLVRSLEAHEAELMSSEKKFRNLVECSIDVIFLLDESGVFRFASPSWEKHFGYPVSEIIGRLFAPFVHPDDVQPCFDYLQKVMTTGQEATSPPYRVKHADGSWRLFVANGTPYIDASGVNMYLGVAHDITEQKIAEEERLRLERKMLHIEKLESLGVLAGGIAHDFNNILTAIMGNISYARTDLSLSQLAYEPLSRAEKAAKRAAGLARQLLVFAKGGALVKRFILLRQTLEDALSLALSGANVQAVVDLAPDLYAVNADEGQISQAFHNIIINAVQSMPAGGVLVVTGTNVDMTANNGFGLAAGDYVKISFRDEGCGIAPEDIDKVFDPYFTSKKTGGTGLGLASTYSIVKKHDGHIAVSSSPGKGATFTIFLPGFGKPAAVEASNDHVSVNTQQGSSILVMDDDEMVRDLADITLKRLGYEVVCCSDGAAALSLYRSALEGGKPFSLVIMDLTIPGGIGGVEAARQILSLDPEARLIVSSGYSDDPVMANYSDYGFCASLEKPYNVEAVSRMLQKYS